MKTIRSFLISGLFFSLCLQFFAANVLAEDSRQHSLDLISAGVSLTPLDQSSFITLPGSKDYTLTLQNTGTSGADAITLTTVTDWPLAFFESDGTTPILDPINLDQGQVKTIIARVVTPLTEEIGGYNTATVTFTSALDSNISTSASITSTIPAPFAQFLYDHTDGILSSIFATSEAQEKILLPSSGFNWSTETNLAVAELPNTNLVYAWTEMVCVYESGGYCYAYASMIFYMICDHAGDEVLAPRLLDDLRGDADNPNDYAPYLTVAPNGDIGVLWYRVLKKTDTFDYQSNIYFSILSENGDFILAPENITNNVIFGYGNEAQTKFKDPRVATTTDGRYFLTWLDGELVNFGMQYDIYYAVFGVNGGGVTIIKNNTLLVDTSDYGPHYTLAALSGDRMIVYWYLNSDLSYRVLDSSGTEIALFGPIPSTTHFVYPDAIQLSDGTIILAGGNSGDICYQFFDGVSYAALGLPACLPNGTEVSVTKDHHDHAILTWPYNPPGKILLYYALLCSDGTVVSPPTNFYTFNTMTNAQSGSRGQGLTTYQHAFAPYFTSTPNTSAVEGVGYLYEITTTDPDLPVDSPIITPSIKPEWLVFTDKADGSATLSGTPATGDIGAHEVELMVQDSSGKRGYQVFSINVTYSNIPPFFTSTGVTTATQDVLYTYNVTADDDNLSQGDALLITASPKPGWLTLSDHGNGTATLSGTPVNTQVGVHDVKLIVTDSHGATADQEFTITVTNVNDPPHFTSSPITNGMEGQLYQYAITTSDDDLLIAMDTLTIRASALPGWLDLIDHGNGTATLSGTPGSTQVGDHSISLVVTDSLGATDTQLFTLTVAQEMTIELIDAEGGTILSPDGEIEITVPPAALTGETEFCYVPQPEPTEDTGSMNFAGISFQLTATETASGDPVTQFAQPLIIKIQYDETSLGEIAEEELRLFYWDLLQNTWLDVVTTCTAGDYTRNLAEDWFSVPICHLSEFAVLEKYGFEIFLPLITR